MTYEAVHVSVSIDASPKTVSEYAGNPENLPKWALGVSNGIRKENGKWITESPMGSVEIRFVGPIEYGILDHDVILPNGMRMHNPMRVLANESGSEVVITLYRLPGMTDADMERDERLIREDLIRLRDLLSA